jgi:serine/threonine protein kinase
MSGDRPAAHRRAYERVGAVLCEKWRLDALVGEGGTGAVFAATHRTGKRVAIKVLHPWLITDARARELFLREAYVANQIDHPAVVSVLDDDVTDDGAPFLVMDLLDGQNCVELLQKRGRPLGEREALRVVEAVLDALAVAHARGVVHRDIKPENVFVCRDGSVKVLDFGLASARELFSPGLSLLPDRTAGTPAFMSPELARGDRASIDERSDVWSVGAMLFTLLSGRWVHHDAAGGLLLAAMSREAPSIANVVPSVSLEVAELVDRALAFDRAGRWPGARTMQIALRSAAKALDERARRRSRPPSRAHERAPTSPSERPAPPVHARPTARGPMAWRPERPLRVAALAALVALGATSLFVWVRGSAGVEQGAAPLGGAAAKVRLRVAASPPGATISLDEKPLPSNPHEGWYEPDGRPHVVRVEAPGFAPVAKVISIERDTRVEIELVRLTLR